jgi:thiol-disulfide isomerase/thioredoxin
MESTGRITDLPVEGRLPSLAGATGWLNSPPLTPAGLRGRVVLIDFWTYTCINWLRTLPHLRAWAERYGRHGLVLVGIHTPEFDVEHDPGNVQRAVTDLGIEYPVAVDSDYAVWDAFANRYWPALYLVDAEGRIRYHHFGEGEYERSEAAIQQLLTEAGATGLGQDPVSFDAPGVQAPADWGNLRSPENYLGYARGENFASPNGAVLDTPHVYALPGRLTLNQWALLGDWTVGREAIVANQAGGRILYRFHARDLHLVMGAPEPGVPVACRVLLDGEPPGAAHGIDVDADGNATIAEPRLYQLLRQPGPITDRTFEITFAEPGVHAYVFTFG